MDTVTYSNKNVIAFIKEYLIPFRLDVSESAMGGKHHAFWTPTTAIFGIKGMNVHGLHEVQREIGFFEPDEFIAVLHLGVAKVRLDQAEFDTALVHLKRLLKNFPASDVIPEAIYFKGVTLYKQNNDPSHLKQAHAHLSSEYSGSTWARRSRPYQLIK
jgi:hypothetical protein